MTLPRLLGTLQASLIASIAFFMLSATAQVPPPGPAPGAASVSTTATPPPAPTMQRKHYRGDGQRHHRDQRHHRAGPRQGRCAQDCMEPRRGPYGQGQRADGTGPANTHYMADDTRRALTPYERNALARCDVFKTRADHRACVERLQQPAQGSVSGGGLLREYSYEVPAEPR